MESPSTNPIEAGSRVNARGDTWTVVERTSFDECASVRLKGCGRANRGSVRTLLTPFDRIVRADVPLRVRAMKPRRLLHGLRRAGSHAHPFGGLRAAAGSRIDILPYQLEPAMATAAGATRLMIADAVGLGKTIQAGLILAELATRSDAVHALVAAPAGLREQWRRELDQHFRLRAVVADAAWLAETARELPSDVNPWVLPAIYIASFDFLKRPEVLRPLEEVTWDALIVDEAHNAALGTARRAAIHAVAVRSRRVVLLTATPHGGDRLQFDALRRIGATGGSAEPLLTFHRTRESVGAGRPRRSVLLAVGLHQAERRMHRLLDDYTDRVCREARSRGDSQARLAAVVLRKRALSSAGSLAASAAKRIDLRAGAPPADARQLMLPLGDEDPLEDAEPDAVLAAPGLADAARERRLLTAIVASATAAATAESKVRFLLRLLARAGEPAIVFTEYRDTLARLRQALATAGFDPLVLHGGQSPAERADVQRAFNASGSLLLATDAASEGLNLQARCRLVIHYELPWSPARLEQRTGRVDRIGQQRRVHEILLVARDTAERMVLAPLVRRAARARGSMDRASRMLDLLTESRVAAAVLERTPQPEDPPDAPTLDDATDALAWTAGAEREAERIGTIRRWRRTSGDAPPQEGDIGVCGLASRAASSRPPQVTAIYALDLVTPDGSVEHSEVIAARRPSRLPPCPRTMAGMKARASAWRRDDEPGVRDLLVRTLGPRVESVAARHEAAVHALERREASIVAELPSAARELIQAGLFDRRALRASQARRRASQDLLDASDARRTALQGAARLTTRLRLLALVLP